MPPGSCSLEVGWSCEDPPLELLLVHVSIVLFHENAGTLPSRWGLLRLLKSPYKRGRQCKIIPEQNDNFPRLFQVQPARFCHRSCEVRSTLSLEFRARRVGILLPDGLHGCEPSGEIPGEGW